MLLLLLRLCFFFFLEGMNSLNGVASDFTLAFVFCCFAPMTEQQIGRNV